MPVPDRVFEAMPRLSDSALRALLALIRLSFRFDPEKSQWVKPERTFSRADVEAECGLSGQGTRNGLRELEDAGYVGVDRSGRSHEHTLEVAVPEARYTYLPTDLLEEAPGLTGTELRLVLTTLRATWGWTTDPSETENGEAPEHRRWARLSTAALARRTGRSESAIKEAASALQGRWLGRRRPSGGAYYYRFRTEALTAETLTTETGPDRKASTPEKMAVQKRREAFLSARIPNDLPPDRQQSGPPRRKTIESFSRGAKQSARPRGGAKSPSERRPSTGNSAVRKGKTPRGRGRTGDGPDPGGEEGVDLTGFSDRKRRLGQKLANVGVWPRRIPELLGRYTAERIEANFQLYRKRAPGVANDGAFLAAAIEGGYALPSPSSGSTGGPEPAGELESANGALPEPGTKVSETRRRELLEAGLAEKGDFDRFADYDDPNELQHLFQLEKTPSPAARP